MRHLRTFLLASCFWAILLPAMAQQVARSTVVHLKQGDRMLPAHQQLEFRRTELMRGQYFRYIQFHTMPSPVERNRLLKAGIELLEYLPERTYIAAIPADFAQSQLVALSVAAVLPIPVQDKLHPDLATQMDETSSLRVQVQFQRNIPLELAKYILARYQAEILAEQSVNQTFTLSIQPILLRRLLAESALLYAELAREVSEKPETFDLGGQCLARTNTLHTAYESGLQLDGSGVNVAIGDDGYIGPHIDFQGRNFPGETATFNGGAHGDMVAGILAGAGNLNPEIQGVARGANLFLYSGFNAVEKAVELYEEDEIILTSTSYGDGCNRGYTTFTQLADRQIWDYPEMMHVFSAGNSGDQDCGYGAGSAWGNITGGVKVGKNVLAVGNLGANGELVFNSSRGPSNDGRIKPDLCANGDGQISTAPNHNYQSSSGSSAAAPIVTGVLAQLIQAYRGWNNGENPPSALLKACLLNTADDLGTPGPDYKHGWGRINARRAYQCLEAEHYATAEVEQSETLIFPLQVPSDVRQARIMLYWHDREGSTVSAKALVNDLDMRVRFNDQEYLPWTLSPEPEDLGQAAQPQADHLNNMEQIVIDLPAAGEYQIEINGYELPFGAQTFYLSYELVRESVTLTYPYGGERLQPGEQVRVHWDSPNKEDHFDLLISFNGGNDWLSLINLPGSQRYFDWSVPGIPTDNLMLQIVQAEVSDLTDAPLSVFPVPKNLEITQVCPEVIRLDWDAVENASAYVVYQLGPYYMDSLMTVNSNTAEVPISDPAQVHWLAITAVGPNGFESGRTVAVRNSPDLMNCEIVHDLNIVSLASPESNARQSCFADSILVSINIRNNGSSPQSNFPLYFQYDDEPVISEIYTGLIPPGVTVNYPFATPLLAGMAGDHQLKVWLDLPDDQASYNDSLRFDLRVVASTMVDIPYFENFDDLENCNQNLNCSQSCDLDNDWMNIANGFGDALDWKIGKGSTPTYGTGPQFDQNTNALSGQYLYLEGAMGCFEKEAYLYSPCLNLGNTVAPQLSFWYHMFGTDIGQLHVDLFAGDNWYNNLMVPLVGEQGTDWQKVEIDLSAFAGQVVTLRFRAYTGDGPLTDLAIDNFAVLDAAAPPVADFRLDKMITCPGQKVYLKDNSYNSPNNWFWEITPSTYSFVEGSANSPNPAVVFHETGLYSVELSVANEYGSHNVVKYDHLLIYEGESLPYTEDFNNTPLPSLEWQIENFDHHITWQNISIPGKSGNVTNAAYVNNHGYNAAGEEDALVSAVINLEDADSPYLRFDLSYATFNGSFGDGLRIELSTDCRESFDEVIYEKSGADLATVATRNIGWQPTQAEHWRTEVIDLSAYVGKEIALRLVNVCGFGNNLYLDNIKVYEYDMHPQAEFIATPIVNELCAGESLTFVATAQLGSNTSYEWDFGLGSQPSSADEAGPHQVAFQYPGKHKIRLRTYNDLGWWDERVMYVQIEETPVANFDFHTSGSGTVDFFAEEEVGYTYYWTFGDGQTSTAAQPSHTYALNGSYAVSLRITNACGEATSLQTVLITTSVDDPNQPRFSLFPNPANDWVAIQLNEQDTNKFQITIYDVSGRKLSQEETQVLQQHRLDISHLSSGVYLVELQSADQIMAQRLVIQ